MKKSDLKNFAKFPEKHLCLRPATLLEKKALAQASSCEFSEIIKNTYFEEYLRTAASVQTFPWEFSETFKAATKAYIEPS